MRLLTRAAPVLLAIVASASCGQGQLQFSSLLGECGDGNQLGGEECDDGNQQSGDGCSAACRIEEYCGNGLMQTGEACDDGNRTAGDGCSPTCTLEAPRCGNGIMEAGEGCDDGNTAGSDGCSTTCTPESLCGNGILQAGEQCEHGNVTSGDGCSSTCQFEGLSESEPNNNSTGAAGNVIADGNRYGGVITLGDIDCFAFDATAGDSYFFEVVTSPVYCDGDTYLKLYDTDGTTQLASDDDGGIDACPLLGWTAPASGRYFICVNELGDNASIPAYFLSMRKAVCGDGRTEGAEECDDNNNNSSDGCSSTCTVETLTESEPNNDATGAAGNVISGGDIYRAAISPAGDVDCFAFDATLGATYTFETRTSLSGCSADTTVELRDTDGTTVLASNDDGGLSPCSRLVWIAPAAGRYFICVHEFGDDAVITSYLLRLHVPVCGDSLLEGSEQCDDGNTTPGDRCSATCAVESSPENEPNGNAAGAAGNVITNAQIYGAAIGTVGDIDCFAFDATLGADYALEVTTGLGTCSHDMFLELFDTNGTTSLGTDDDSGIGTCPLLRWNALATGRYFVCITDYGGDDAVPLYFLNLRIPTCGDGIIDGAETCDDNNTTAGDGCSATCSIESTQESEPNNNAATGASNMIAVGDTYAAAINPTGDVDCFAFDGASGVAYTFETFTDSVGSCPSADTSLEIRDTGVTPMAYANDGGVLGCSLLTWTAPATGRFYVCAQSFDSSLIPVYYLSMR